MKKIFLLILLSFVCYGQTGLFLQTDLYSTPYDQELHSTRGGVALVARGRLKNTQVELYAERFTTEYNDIAFVAGFGTQKYLARNFYTGARVGLALGYDEKETYDHWTYDHGYADFGGQLVLIPALVVGYDLEHGYIQLQATQNTVSLQLALGLVLTRTK